MTRPERKPRGPPLDLAPAWRSWLGVAVTARSRREDGARRRGREAVPRTRSFTIRPREQLGELLDSRTRTIYKRNDTSTRWDLTINPSNRSSRDRELAIAFRRAARRPSGPTTGRPSRPRTTRPEVRQGQPVLVVFTKRGRTPRRRRKTSLADKRLTKPSTTAPSPCASTRATRSRRRSSGSRPRRRTAPSRSTATGSWRQARQGASADPSRSS